MKKLEHNLYVLNTNLLAEKVLVEILTRHPEAHAMMVENLVITETPVGRLAHKHGNPFYLV